MFRQFKGETFIKILKEIYYKILFDTPALPPESGGIIGGKNNIISLFYADLGVKSNENEYCPDISKLNSIISQWSNQGIEFYGIYHSHYSSGTVLSINDKKYISKILINNPCNYLHFPIVFPKDKIISYKAEFKGKEIVFSRKKIVFIK